MPHSFIMICKCSSYFMFRFLIPSRRLLRLNQMLEPRSAVDCESNKSEKKRKRYSHGILVALGCLCIIRPNRPHVGGSQTQTRRRQKAKGRRKEAQGRGEEETRGREKEERGREEKERRRTCRRETQKGRRKEEERRRENQKGRREAQERGRQEEKGRGEGEKGRREGCNCEHLCRGRHSGKAQSACTG